MCSCCYPWSDGRDHCLWWCNKRAKTTIIHSALKQRHVKDIFGDTWNWQYQIQYIRITTLGVTKVWENVTTEFLTRRVVSSLTRWIDVVRIVAPNNFFAESTSNIIRKILRARTQRGMSAKTSEHEKNKIGHTVKNVPTGFWSNNQNYVSVVCYITVFEYANFVDDIWTGYDGCTAMRKRKEVARNEGGVLCTAHNLVCRFTRNTLQH